MIHDDLIPVLESLKSLDAAEQLSKKHFQETGRLWEPNDRAKVQELLDNSDFSIQTDSASILCSIRDAISNEDWNQLAEIMFSEEVNFPRDVDVVLSRSTRYCVCNVHEHDYYEIECVLSGSAIQFIGTTQMNIFAGDVIVQPPHVPHDLQVNGDSIVINIGIRKTTFHRSFRQLLEDNLPLSRYFQQTLKGSRYMTSLIFHCGDDNYWFDNLLWLYKQHMEKRPYYTQIINRQTQASLYYIMQKYSPEESILSDKATTERMGEIYRFISMNYQTVTLKKLSQNFNLTVPYLSSSIKKYFGKTFSQILRNVRLSHAKELLKTDMRIVDICQSVGYGNESNFIQIFKDEFGTTPKQYKLAGLFD